MQVPQKTNVVGTQVSTTSYGELAELCYEWARTRDMTRSRFICVTSVHGVIEARRDEALRSALDEADVVTPDGMPVVWALRSFGMSDQQRVYGPTLMLSICEEAARKGVRLFLYGARLETLRELKKRLCEAYLGIRIVGLYAPPFRPLTEEEDAQVCEMIEATGAHIVFVGLSTPKQEKWMHAHRDSIRGTTMIGVGAAFDFHAGRTPQAPDWMQRNGLEWLFRLKAEPGRLWRRYLLITPQFLPLWFMQWMRERRRVMRIVP